MVWVGAGSHPVWEMEVRKKSFSTDIVREICTDSFYTVNSELPRVPLTAVPTGARNIEEHHRAPVGDKM